MLDLRRKYQSYSLLARPDLGSCDSLLFTSLLEASRDSDFDITQFRDAAGRWHRCPAKDCYPKKSKSTISRDMILGLMWYAHIKQRQDIVDGLWDYAHKHLLKMGDGAASRIFMTPGLMSTLAELRFKLSGKSSLWRKVPAKIRSDLSGFEAHLAVLHLLLRKQLGCKVDKKVFQAYAKRQTQNALFQYAAGHFAQAAALLLSKRLFPHGRLPQSSDRHEGWLWQRDHGNDWQPSHGHQTHTGGDFLFVAFLLLRELDNVSK